MSDKVDQQTKHLSLEQWTSLGITFALVLAIMDPSETFLGRLIFSLVIVGTAVVAGPLFTKLKIHLNQRKVSRERTQPKV